MLYHASSIVESARYNEGIIFNTKDMRLVYYLVLIIWQNATLRLVIDIPFTTVLKLRVLVNQVFLITKSDDKFDICLAISC